MLPKISEKLRSGTELPKDHAEYLNPASVPNYFKPLKKLYDMCDVSIPWKRVYATYPELDNVTEPRGRTKEEIAAMLRHTRDPMDRALILVLSSSGVRAGGLDLAWGDVTPVYLVDGRLVLDPGPGDHKIACAALRVYRGSPECYTTFITPEAHRALQEYGRDTWRDLMGREAGPSDPVFIRSKGAPVRASEKLLEKRIRRMATQARLHDAGGGRVRRHEVPLMNGFRRFFNKVGKEALSHDSPLAALIKEYMMGHQGTTPLDQNYFKTDVLELAAEYVNVVPDLTIDDAERLRRSNRVMSENIQHLEDEKDAKIAQLEAHIRRMEEDVSKINERESVQAEHILEALLKSPKAGGLSSEVAESLTGLMRQMAKSQDEAIREIRAECNAKIEGMRREMDRMAGRGNAGRDPPAGSGEDGADGEMYRSGPRGRGLES